MTRTPTSTPGSPSETPSAMVGSLPGGCAPVCGEAIDGVFITWTKWNTRSHILATYFDVDEVNFHHLRSQRRSVALALLRYIWLTGFTFAYLTWRRPKVVFTVNVPVPAAMITCMWGIMFRRRVVIDNHSGLFEHRRWQWTQSIAKPLFRTACLCIAAAPRHASILSSWGVHTEIMGALVLPEEQGQTNSLQMINTNIVVISTFSPDEPLEEILAAARTLSNYKFFVTGHLKNAPRHLLSLRPSNVEFTDYLPGDEYLKLVKTSMCAVVLVKDDDTMQRGAYEAMSCETPVITSDWPVLRDAFYKGTLFVDNTSVAIADAVVLMARERPRLKSEIIQLKGEQSKSLSETVARIKRTVLSTAKNANAL